VEQSREEIWCLSYSKQLTAHLDQLARSAADFPSVAKRLSVQMIEYSTDRLFLFGPFFFFSYFWPPCFSLSLLELERLWRFKIGQPR
jgi:hypothetical protein